ncbi:predicted protein [Chaetoceros tenuissimus]|uniref:ALMS motif domain-containing protein n=1 Tax=Chaetoceros tenuissimus TaxID=426638 RepID=A0AAD3CX60_9STRA|nr:predicted protein [Chaetoceros tenuissimus]
MQSLHYDNIYTGNTDDVEVFHFNATKDDESMHHVNEQGDLTLVASLTFDYTQTFDETDLKTSEKPSLSFIGENILLPVTPKSSNRNLFKPVEAVQKNQVQRDDELSMGNTASITMEPTHSFQSLDVHKIDTISFQSLKIDEEVEKGDEELSTESMGESTNSSRSLKLDEEVEEEDDDDLSTNPSISIVDSDLSYGSVQPERRRARIPSIDKTLDHLEENIMAKYTAAVDKEPVAPILPKKSPSKNERLQRLHSYGTKKMEMRRTLDMIHRSRVHVREFKFQERLKASKKKVELPPLEERGRRIHDSYSTKKNDAGRKLRMEIEERNQRNTKLRAEEIEKNEAANREVRFQQILNASLPKTTKLPPIEERGRRIHDTYAAKKNEKGRKLRQKIEKKNAQLMSPQKQLDLEQDLSNVLHRLMLEKKMKKVIEKSRRTTL